MKEPDSRKTDQGAPVNPKKILDVAQELANVTEAVLTTAVDLADRPVITAAALRLADHALRKAMIKSGTLTTEQADEAIVLADGFFAKEGDAAVALAEEAIRLRLQTAHPPSTEELEEMMKMAADLLVMLDANELHPSAQLVVLFLARRMADVSLQQDDPAEYEAEKSRVRAMENALNEDALVIQQHMRPMTKGGDA